MNIDYKLGNVIKNTSVQDFSRYAFPAELPTEEWKGDEARSYVNYIRPITNLFENDRENLGLSKDLYKNWNYDSNSLISGCDIVKTGNYYEVSHGAFAYNSVIYYVFPRCEAAAKQLEEEYENAGNTADSIKIKITYDVDSNKYSAMYSINNGEVEVSDEIMQEIERVI